VRKDEKEHYRTMACEKQTADIAHYFVLNKASLCSNNYYYAALELPVSTNCTELDINTTNSFSLKHICHSNHDSILLFILMDPNPSENSWILY
jgi:hypothetical protein